MELRAWWQGDGSSSVQMHPFSHLVLRVGPYRISAGQGQTCASLSMGMAEGPGATCTLMSLLGAAGQGPPIFTRPVKVVGWAPTDVAPQGVGTTLGYYAPSWLDLDHQRGLVCWGRERRGHSGRRPPACTIVSDISALPKTRVPNPSPCSPDLVSLKFPGSPASPVTSTQDHGPTYPVAGTDPLAHWGYPHILWHTCKEEQGPAVSDPRGPSASEWTWGARSSALCPVWGEEALSSGRTSETKKAPPQGLWELRKGSVWKCQ